MTKTESFWKWFAKNCNNFGEHFDNTALIEELDRKVRELGDLSWEVGPGKTPGKALVISPGGKTELLPYTKAIIEHSIKCTGWEYHYAKPPKQWNMLFHFKTASGDRVEIDAAPWEYVLLQFEDGMFEIILKAPGTKELADDDKLIAAEILLDGVIGEELRITTICLIDVVNEFEIDYKDKAGSIKNLSIHINALIGQE